MAAYTSRIESYNQAHGTDYADYDQIVLATRAADTEGLEREDWEYYVRNELKLQFIRLDQELAPSYRAFLLEQLYPTIA